MVQKDELIQQLSHRLSQLERWKSKVESDERAEISAGHGKAREKEGRTSGDGGDDNSAVSPTINSRGAKSAACTGTACCVQLSAVVALLAGLGYAALFNVQSDAEWRHAANTPFLEAPQTPRSREPHGLPSSYAVLKSSTQRLYVRTSIKEDDVSQCVDGDVDCSALPVGAGTLEWCAAPCAHHLAAG